MNSLFHIRRTTAILTIVIASLVGALVATVGITHKAPVAFETAHAAALSDQVPFGSFSPVLKRARAVVIDGLRRLAQPPDRRGAGACRILVVV